MQHEEGCSSPRLVHGGRRSVVEMAGLGSGQQVSSDGRDPGYHSGGPPPGCATDHHVGDGAPGAHLELQIDSSPHGGDANAQQGLPTRLVKSLHNVRAFSLAFQMGACFCRRCALMASGDICTPQKAQCWLRNSHKPLSGILAVLAC